MKTVWNGFAILTAAIVVFGVNTLSSSLSVDPQPVVVSPLVIPYYPVPEHQWLCGEAVPLDIPEVRERFDREFTIAVYGHAQIYLWLKRVERYFPWLEQELKRSGLPDDLKYVAVAESDLMLSASSPAGAAGPWQFISSTGSNYGLAVSKRVDERYDFEKSTVSAFRYLRDLHSSFQNWTLAIAGYNCGEKRVQDEMKRQQGNSYYVLKLPNETERYIFRILAIKEILSHPEKYGYSLPKGAGYAPLQVIRVGVVLPFAVPIQTVAEASGITYREFKTLNPAFTSDVMPEGSHTLKIPETKGNDFKTRLQAAMANVQPATVVHKVCRGETLISVAEHYGVSLDSVREWNQLKGDTVRIGQELKILK